VRRLARDVIRLAWPTHKFTRRRKSLEPGKAPEPFGAGNRTAIFEENYLEVLAHTDLRLWNATTPEQRGPYNLDVRFGRALLPRGRLGAQSAGRAGPCGALRGVRLPGRRAGAGRAGTQRGGGRGCWDEARTPAGLQPNPIFERDNIRGPSSSRRLRRTRPADTVPGRFPGGPMYIWQKLSHQRVAWQPSQCDLGGGQVPGFQRWHGDGAGGTWAYPCDLVAVACRCPSRGDLSRIRRCSLRWPRPRYSATHLGKSCRPTS